MTPKNYHIAFIGNLPDEITPQGVVKSKIHYKPDALHFETQQEMMEFFENPEKLAHHLGTSRVVKMMTHNYKDGKMFEPTVIASPYFQGENGQKMWWNEVREIDLGFPALTKKILNKDGR